MHHNEEDIDKVIACPNDDLDLGYIKRLAAVMARFMIRGVRRTHILKHNVTTKYFIIFFCLFCSLVFWSYPPVVDIYDRTLAEEALNNVAQDARFAEVYRKKTHLPKDLKYVLLWTDREFAPFYDLEIGQRAFISNNCSTINCFVTSDRYFFGGDLKKFDVIAFNGRNLKENLSVSYLPSQRYSHQKYIYVNAESASNYPVCNNMYDRFFNWTMTYRLDSDIIFHYILIKNTFDEYVGPKINMEWVDMKSHADDRELSRLKNKNKAAAWFVSNCVSKSQRERLASNLKTQLKQYGYDVDIYGDCGELKCPRKNQTECNKMLEKNYYFYLSLENSFDKDYITEKVLTALHHDIVPIVYGGANYSRFLPPGSYINSLEYSEENLAKKMYKLIQSPEDYLKYFQWKYYYKYENTESFNVCSFCEALNNKTKMETYSSYPDFRKWWNPKDSCA